MRNLKGWLIGAGTLAIIVLLLSWNLLFPPTPPKPITNVDPATLAGVQTGNFPWPAEIQNLRARLQAIGLPSNLSMEGQVLHIHQHIDISINGQTVEVPANMGINQAAGFISPVHTHDTTGVIHVESPTMQTFTLGQFFDVWGVRFKENCIGGYCADAAHVFKVYSNGQPVAGDPRLLPLASHQEIFLYYGDASGTPKTIPSSYQFAAGE
jgi:hypothetical protein